MDRLSFNLTPLPPFRLDLTVWALRRRSDNLIDRWDGRTYSRVLMLNGLPAEVNVTQRGTIQKPLLRVSAAGTDAAKTKSGIVASLEKLLGIRKDLSGFYSLAMRDERLGPLAKRFYGLKPPRFVSVFEALINAFACQQLTLTVGIKLLNRLTMACGTAARDEKAASHAFPRPEDILRMNIEEFRSMGFSRQKTGYLTGLAHDVAEGRLDLEKMDKIDDEAVLEYLGLIKGVGRWSAEYVLLRGLGRLNVYPGDDVGARNKLQEWLHLKKHPNYDTIKKLLSPWKPYQGMIYFHLLLDSLEREGHINMESKWAS